MYADHYLLVRARSETARSAMVERCYASAYEALEKSDDSGAKRLFAMLAIMAPRDERAWVGLAVCSERQGNWPMAAAMYRMGTALAGDSGWSHFGRGRALKRMGKHKDALCALARAEELGADTSLLSAIEEERRSP